ncbi:MAG: hypothetical protein PWQ69_1081 [Methanomicrobiaceae archaeon]|nr:hypothetical protein [Methanomicrobiaceae archaeon]
MPGGESTLPGEEQDDLEGSPGYYLIKATEGVVISL